MIEGDSCVILAAGGPSRFWVNRHRLRVDGNEVLIHRTIRQVHEQTSIHGALFTIKAAVPIWLAVRDPADFADCVVAGILKLNYWTGCETLYDMQPFWGTRRTIVLLGDVFYTDDCIRQIVAGEKTWYCNAAEIFGMSLRARDYPHVKKALWKAIGISRDLKARLKSGTAAVNADCNMWSWYRLFHGYSYHRRWYWKNGQRVFPDDSPGLCFPTCDAVQLIEDETTDFDTPEQYERWRAGRRGAGCKVGTESRVRIDA